VVQGVRSILYETTLDSYTIQSVSFLLTLCHSRENGNPDSVPAKAGNHLRIGFLFSQETLDSCFRRNDESTCNKISNIFV
jgi:hypothetical protein